MADARQPYDVRFLPEGTLRADDPAKLDFSQYRTLILPECRVLTDRQGDALLAFLDGGGTIVSLGVPGENLAGDRRSRIVEHLETTIVDSLDSAHHVEPQVRHDGEIDLAINVVRTSQGAAVHLIRYDYDDGIDAVPILPELVFTIRLDDDYDRITTYTPSGTLECDLHCDGDRYRITLRQMSIYAIVHLKRSAS
jgi:hypothetical protein